MVVMHQSYSFPLHDLLMKVFLVFKFYLKVFISLVNDEVDAICPRPFWFVVGYEGKSVLL